MKLYPPPLHTYTSPSPLNSQINTQHTRPLKMLRSSLETKTSTSLKPSLLKTFRPKSNLLTDAILFFSGSISTLFLTWVFSSFFTNPSFQLQQQHQQNHSPPFPSSSFTNNNNPPSTHKDNPSPTFYDDPTLTYTLEKPIKNWDQQRSTWLSKNPSFDGNPNRILILTGSQPEPCRNPAGDHLLLRFFKNKVDYCRIHGYDIFYSNAFLHPNMTSFWSKLPLIRATMIARPETEWIWWVDSDAAFTDMEFKIPIEKYKDHNLVVHGWEHEIYVSKSWYGFNAGVFLIRNCQWSLDLLHVWANMGPMSPAYDEWGKLLSSTFKNKIFPEADDQSALLYLFLKGKWGDKIYIESDYLFEGYWFGIVGRYENVSERYALIEREERVLRRRHAEKVGEFYGELRGELVSEDGNGGESWKRPFVTHFAGCQPCNGNYKRVLYSGEDCWEGMERALNFGDNQVLRNFGFVHNNLLDSGVSPLPFDYPA